MPSGRGGSNLYFSYYILGINISLTIAKLEWTDLVKLLLMKITLRNQASANNKGFTIWGLVEDIFPSLYRKFFCSLMDHI